MKCCLKDKVFKSVSILLCFILAFGSFSGFAYAAEDDYELSQEAFYEELAIMMSASDDYDSTIKVESTENGETVTEDKTSTNRLIVSTDSNQDLSRNYGAISKIEGYNNWHIFQYRTYEEASLAYEAFSQTDGVNFVEFDELIEFGDFEVEPTNSGEYEALSWGANYVQSVTANEAILSSGMELPEVVVAVIDTGVDSTHSFFNKDESNPRVLRGNRSSDNAATEEHGTHVAGIIVDNTLPNIKIKPYNYFYYRTKEVAGTTVTLATEIHSAVEDEVDVINMSLGGWSIFVKSDTVVNEISNAVENNIPVVVAAGNEYTNASLVFPANDPNVITVAAVSENSVPAIFSNFGDCVDIAAPGVDINSTMPSDAYSNNNYGLMDGTSMAAPFVSAAVAMMKTLYPNLTPVEIKEKLVSSATVPKGWSGRYGKGILNFENIIKNDRLAYPTINLSKDGATINSAVSDATVYYTTDGTAPIIGESKIYSSEIIDTTNIKMIRAIAYKEGYLPSYAVTKHMKFTVSDCVVRYKGTTELPYIPDSKIIRCYSSNPEVVTVDYNGNITGLITGEATVTVYYENNQVGTYEVTVEYTWWQWFIRIFLFGIFWY